MIKYYETIDKYTPDVIEAETSVFIREVALIKDNVDDEILLRVTFANSGTESVRALAINIKIWDIFGEQITASGKEVLEYVYQDTDFGPQSLFGNKIPVVLPKETRKVEVTLTKAVFSNASVWKSDPTKQVHTQAQALIEGTDEFTETLTVEGEVPALFLYAENEECWQCTCGATNLITSQSCFRCSRTKSKCRETFNSSNIHDKYEVFRKEKERIAEEKRKVAELARRELERQAELKRIEKEKAEQEKQRIEAEAAKVKAARNKKITIIGYTVAAVCLAGLFIFGYAIPEHKRSIQFNEAQELLDAEKYEEAMAAFEELGDYNDAPAKVNEAFEAKNLRDYNEAVALMDNGEYDKAIQILQKIGDFNDANDKLKEASEKSKEIAREAAEKAKEAKYKEAATLEESGEYNQAAVLYESLGGYKDSTIATLYVRGLQKFSEEEWTDALTYFYKLEDYKDTQSLIQQATENRKQKNRLNLMEKALQQYADGDYYNAYDNLKYVYELSEEATQAYEYLKPYGEAMEYIKKGDTWNTSQIVKELDKEYIEAFPDLEEQIKELNLD